MTGVQTCALRSGLSVYAPLASPTFTGTVTLPNNQTVTSTTTPFLTFVDFSPYAPKASQTFTGTVTLPNGTTIAQNSAAFLTSIPNNYLTTSTSISQSQINDTSVWLTTAIAANASAIAAIAAGSLFVDAAGVLIYAKIRI